MLFANGPQNQQVGTNGAAGWWPTKKSASCARPTEQGEKNRKQSTDEVWQKHTTKRSRTHLQKEFMSSSTKERNFMRKSANCLANIE